MKNDSGRSGARPEPHRRMNKQIAMEIYQRGAKEQVLGRNPTWETTYSLGELNRRVEEYIRIEEFTVAYGTAEGC